MFPLYFLSMESSRRFANFLENLKKKRKNFVTNLILKLFLKAQEKRKSKKKRKNYKSKKYSHEQHKNETQGILL